MSKSKFVAELSANSVRDFTAAENITAGDIVKVNSNGDLEKITGSNESAAFLGATTLYTGNPGNVWSLCWVEGTNELVFFYWNGSNLVYQIGTYNSSDSTCTLAGTEYVLWNQAPRHMHPIYDPISGRIVVLWTQGNNGQLYTNIITVSGTTASHNTRQDMGIIPLFTRDGNAVSYDIIEQKFVFVYALEDGSGVYNIHAHTFTHNNTTVSMSGATTVWAGEGGGGANPNFKRPTDPQIMYHPYSGKHALAWDQLISGGDEARCLLLTVSGSTISSGPSVQINPKDSQNGISINHQDDEKIVFGLSSSNFQNYHLNLGTISGNSITLEPRMFPDSSHGHYGVNPSNAVYDSKMRKMTILCERVDDAGTEIFEYNATSSTSLSTAKVNFSSGVRRGIGRYSASNERTAYFYTNTSIGFMLLANFYRASGLLTNADRWIGVAKNDINANDTGTLKIIGGIVPGFSGLTINSTYYVDGYGNATASESSSYGKVGRAVSSTELYITEG